MRPRLVTYRVGGHGVARMAWVIADQGNRLELVTLGTRERRTLTEAERATVLDYREPKVVAPRGLAELAAYVH